MEAWLVYEINSVQYADVPFCSKLEMEVFENQADALTYMQDRKQKYIEEDNDWTLDFETENCITFLDDLKEGSFDIRLIRLA